MQFSIFIQYLHYLKYQLRVVLITSVPALAFPDSDELRAGLSLFTSCTYAGAM